MQFRQERRLFSRGTGLPGYGQPGANDGNDRDE
jgi:hypothetical protein